jgi:Gpi18-like mannosyltransferase
MIPALKQLAKARVISYALTISSLTSAALIVCGNDMKYDDVQNISWLQDANLTNSDDYWHTAKEKAETLEFVGDKYWQYNRWTVRNGYVIEVPKLSTLANFSLGLIRLASRRLNNNDIEAS